MAHGSKKAVVTAIVSNGIVTLIKFATALAGGSASMMNEAVHSLMDTLHQGFFQRGLGHPQQRGPWCASGLYALGAGLGLAYAWHAWCGLGSGTEPVLVGLFGVYYVDPRALNLAVLALAFLIQGYSFKVAVTEFLAAMRCDGLRGPWRRLLRSHDSALVAVLEGVAAMLGLALAALGVGLAAYTGNAVWDLVFSVLIALLLGLVAFCLWGVNRRLPGDAHPQAGGAPP